MERLIGSWWSASETDVLPAGQGADGYRAVAFHGAGTGYPLYEDLKKYVFDAGKAAGDGTHAGEVLYNRGLYAAALAAEAARTAMRLADTTKLTPAMMRDGLENLTLDGARMARIGLPGFGPEIRNSCAAHGNPGDGAIQRWDATERRWSLITGFSAADREVVDSLVAADSRAYAAENRISPLECAE
jgi:branched-chain amino acid transport system substrate-binding protein